MWDGVVETIERVQTPRGELVLQKRGDDFEIISNGTFLMATYNGESEQVLVREAIRKVLSRGAAPPGEVVDMDAGQGPSGQQAGLRVLIGGLGVSFSLQEALAHSSVAHVRVIEIEPVLIAWNREKLGDAAKQALADERTVVEQRDIVEWLWDDLSENASAGDASAEDGSTEDRYDVICLDVDNGSDWTVFEQNRSLYTPEGLDRLYQRLTPGGVLAFWNARRDKTFESRLRTHFDGMELHTVPHPAGEPDVVYIVWANSR